MASDLANSPLPSPCRPLLALVASLVLSTATGCIGTGEDEAPDFSCQPGQDSPYADGTPYLGIHADPGNSDVVACTSASSFELEWTALDGYGMTQPNTFSPDGQVTYATTSHPEPDGCRLHAVDVSTGELRWCRSYPPSVSLGAIEVDEDGNLFFTAEDQLVALDQHGSERWTRSFGDVHGDKDAPWGVHFTPHGHIATVTSAGTVYLVQRHDGAVLAQLSIPETWGFVAPPGLEVSVDISTLFPDSVRQDIETVWGETSGETAETGFSALMGAGAFCDNTVGISPSGNIYVIGGGPSETQGALVQILVEGTPNAPVLRPGWHSPTQGGSATSPSISSNDRYVVIGDGSSTAALLNPGTGNPAGKVMDIFACDNNTDDDPDPSVCAVAYEEALERAPMVGAPAILPDGTFIFWEFGLDFAADDEARDIAAYGPNGMVWEAALPDGLDWTSVITVTDNHLLGTASRVQPSSEQFLSLTFPRITEDVVVVLDRSNGELVWQHELPDDGTATVTIDRDGAIYVGVMGFLSILATEDRPNLGLLKFRPTGH